MTVVDDWLNDMDDGEFDGVREIMYERMGDMVEISRQEFLAYWDDMLRFAIMIRSGFHEDQRPPVAEVSDVLRRQMSRIDHHVNMLLRYREGDKK